MTPTDWIFVGFFIVAIGVAIWCSEQIWNDVKKGNYRVRVWVSPEELRILQEMREKDKQ